MSPVGRGVLAIGVTLFAVGFFLNLAVGAIIQKHKAITSSQRTKRADDLFRRNCARCHGADGQGKTQLGIIYNAPDFTDESWWRKHSKITSTRSLTSIVTRGKGGMPAFGKKLNRAQIVLLVNHVRQFRNKSVPPSSP